MNDTIDIRGVHFHNVDLTEATEICRSFLQTDGMKIIHTPNSEIVQLCIEKPEYYGLINAADLVIPDGSGVILASKILRRPLKKGKVAGIELCESLLALCAREGYGVFFLGGKPGVAQTAAERMEEKYPGLNVCGVHDGYFKEDAAVIREINDSGADLLLVCLGVPKQEAWMADHRSELSVRLAGGFGGSLDVFAGNVKRAPRIFIKLGLEWFYRLLCEPKRIGRMMKLPKFLIGTIFHGKK